MSSSLQELPNELLHKIFSDAQLSRKDWKSVRLVNGRLAAVMNERLFSSVKISWGVERCIGNSAVERLTDANDNAGGLLARCVRKLSIESLDSKCCEGSTVVPAEESGDTKSGTRSLEKDFYLNGCGRKDNRVLFLNSLENVTTVSWTIGIDQQELHLDAIFRSLSSLPSLSDFSLRVLKKKHAEVYPLQHFRNLRTFSFTGHLSEHDEVWVAVLSPLQQMLRRCPDLTTLRLLFDCRDKNSSLSLSLQDFLSKCDARLQIMHLTLSGFDLGLNEENLRQLKHLRSLELSNPSDSVPLMFWRNLYDHGIQLTEINAVVNESLVTFLEEYSGLHKLVLNTDLVDDTIAHRFFKAALPRYFRTLESLDVSKAFCGDWCIGYHNEKVIMQCAKLHTLSICFGLDDLVYCNERIIEVLRDLSEHPSLRRVRLTCALMKTISMDRDHVISRDLMERANRRLQSAVGGLRILPVDKPVIVPTFEVEIGEHTYQGVGQGRAVVFLRSDSQAL